MSATLENGLRTAAGQRPTVIVIDANPTTRLIAAALIDQFGGLVTGFASVAEARGAVDRGADVIVARGGDPDSGRLGETAGSTPLVMIGGPGKVPNPYSPRELYQALSAALQGRTSQAAASS
jgi:hypothetical protein